MPRMTGPFETYSSRGLKWALGAMLLLLAAAWVHADPPGRAARLAYMDGPISFSPAGQDDWVQATVNRPLTTGDRLWADAGTRAELQLGGAAIRLGALTNVSLLNVDDNITQLQLLQGALKLRVRHLGDNQIFEVDTPNLAFTVRRAGDYRIDVDPNGNSTAVMVISGEAEVYGDSAAYAVRARQGYRFYGTGLGDYDTFATRRDDDLDRWALERDRRFDNSSSARYVSAELVGYEDLDSNGTWSVDASYGNVWIPSRVAVGWTPYRDGHWAWVDPWGWTWIDDAPWGYAVTHYGRWARIDNVWGWVPGPQRELAVYAPALVVFLGGRDFQASVAVGASIGNVGWFPLAPREVYQPAYQVSRGYFEHINRSNAVIAPAAITNVYNTNVTNITNVTNVTNVTKVVYANQAVAGAVVAVPAHAFVQSQSVAKLAVAVPAAIAMAAPVTHMAAIAPVAQSVQGGASGARTQPAAHGHSAVVARTPPPPAPIPFAAQVAQLAAKPGAPIDEPRRALLKPAMLAEPAAKVNVVAAAKVVAPTAMPPVTAPAPKTPDQRKALANAVASPPVAVASPVAAASKPAVTSADTSKADAAKASAAAAAQAASEQRAEAVRAEAQKRAAENAEAFKLGATKAQAAKDDAARAAEAAKVEAAKKAEADRLNAANAANAARAEAARAEALKKTEADRANAAKAEAAKAEAAKAAEAVRKAEAQKANAAKADAERAQAQAQAQAVKAEAVKAREQAERAQQAKARESKAEDSKASRAHSPGPNNAAKSEDDEKEKERIRAEEAKKR